MTINDILSKARAEIGVKETGENCVKYNDAYWGAGTAGAGYPWCVVFLWWLFKGSGVKFPDTAHCDGVRAFAKNAGRWVTGGYQAGDCVIFDYNGDGSGDHIGLVESVNGGTLTTIEGNYSDSVARVQRQAGSVYGAYRPLYDDGGSSVTISPEPVCASCTVSAEPVYTVSVSVPMLMMGSTGDSVFALQSLLIAWGYSCGDAGADGDFGAMTHNAVTTFQRDFNLEADGIAGANTWRVLLNGR